VTLVLSTHSEGGLTEHDIELARRINDIAGQDE
jgi:pterin-4a-carbinolamine dehydratase